MLTQPAIKAIGSIPFLTLSSGHNCVRTHFLVSLLLQFAIFGRTGKFEFNSDWPYPSPGDAGGDSLGQDAADDVKEDLKFESERSLEGSQ